jgi:hypothetical protein
MVWLLKIQTLGLLELKERSPRRFELNNLAIRCNFQEELDIQDHANYNLKTRVCR